ncbi:Serine/threonine protein phosphatase PP1 isozyme 3 [Histomonas meleagridis]|uniref:Serine/threonine protein phosphatase PP1 isozyme 3 n=1 Tax=Histomonas meleagridis TaxID=135588 RepID=UPI00355A87F9|nr:Serine/threonine protein phosphatase PP1 isozyme 3 [Histomonas meleagridis]KAH0800209.1 Serine/threonine protein phosphatase PP1 isozyme 3 [Histomonas meleagridis]
MNQQDGFTLSSDDKATVQLIYKKLISSRGLKQSESVPLTAQDLRLICTLTTQALLKDPMLLQIQAPICVVGDLHGQFNDLLQYLEKGGNPETTKYLFLGDYVDRGDHSIETVTLLFCMKLLYPQNVYLLRGNHETETISELYGFLGECKLKHNRGIWKTFNEVFRYLPLAAVISSRIFCVHGGISGQMQSLEMIEELPRPLDIPENGFISDLVWADPSADYNGFQESERGTSYTFGADVANDFLDKYDFDLICRAHQVVPDGYEFPFYPQQTVVTVFSASNYCGEYGNKGAMLKIDAKLSCSFEFVESEGDTLDDTHDENAFC